VVARADADALGAEDLGDVVGMDPLDREGDDRRLGARRADDPQPRDLGQPRGRQGEQLALPGGDGGEPEGAQVVDRRREARRFERLPDFGQVTHGDVSDKP